MDHFYAVYWYDVCESGGMSHLYAKTISGSIKVAKDLVNQHIDSLKEQQLFNDENESDFLYEDQALYYNEEIAKSLQLLDEIELVDEGQLEQIFNSGGIYCSKGSIDLETYICIKECSFSL